VQCYTGPGVADPIAVVELLSAEGKGIMSFPVSELPGGKSRLELPIRNLGKGTYLLRVRAKSGEMQVEDVTAFKVIP
jgi:hypothetical protein